MDVMRIRRDMTGGVRGGGRGGVGATMRVADERSMCPVTLRR